MLYVNKMREYYRNKPRLYRNLCYLLSGLFNFAYLAVIALYIGIIYFLYTFCLKKDSSIYTMIIFGALIIIMVYCLIRTVFLKKVKIKGIYLNRDTYSRIWEITDILTDKFRGIRIRDIIVTDKVNINVTVYNSRGIWGRRKAALEIGLPILLGFSEKEIEQFIALTICSNSKNRGFKDKKIVYTYKKIEHILRKDNPLIKSNFIMKITIVPIYQLIYKFYKEACFMVNRENMIEGDKLFLSKYTGKELRNIILKKYIHRYLIDDVFMKKTEKIIEDKGEVPSNLFTLMNKYLNEQVSGRDIILALKIIKGISRDTLIFIGSPINRIESINENIDDFQYEFGDNSVRLLGKNFVKIEKKFNLIWHKEKMKNIKKLIDSILRKKEIYNDLCDKFNKFNLKESDFKLYMNLREKFAGANTAIIEGKKLCIGYPNNAEIRYIVGKMLIEGDNVQGIEYIESAIKLYPYIHLLIQMDLI